MRQIIARVEGDDFIETHEFSSLDVMAHHNPTGAASWDELSDEEQRSLSEDFALWQFYRRYGNTAPLRVDVEERVAPAPGR